MNKKNNPLLIIVGLSLLAGLVVSLFKELKDAKVEEPMANPLEPEDTTIIPAPVAEPSPKGPLLNLEPFFPSKKDYGSKVDGITSLEEKLTSVPDEFKKYPITQRGLKNDALSDQYSAYKKVIDESSYIVFARNKKDPYVSVGLYFQNDLVVGIVEDNKYYTFEEYRLNHFSEYPEHRPMLASTFRSDSNTIFRVPHMEEFSKYEHTSDFGSNSSSFHEKVFDDGSTLVYQVYPTTRGLIFQNDQVVGVIKNDECYLIK